jgi:Nif-specific regulatory protein
MSSLVAISGPDSGRRYVLGERARIGRASDNQIALADSRVSRYHAEVTREGIEFILRDLGSKNGVQVNGEPITMHRLRYGDQIVIGQTHFSFEPAKEFKTARFSDIVVSVAHGPASETRVFDASMLASRPADRANQAIEQAGRLLDIQAEELPDALRELLAGIMAQFQAQGGSILLRTNSDEFMPLVATAPGGRLWISGDVAGVALNEGKSILCSAMTSQDGQGLPDRAMLVPLERQGGIFGALYLERPDGQPYGPEDIGLLRSISRLAGGAARMAIQMDQMAMVVEPAASQEVPFVGVSTQAESVRERIRRIGASDATVLLTGETGTGKELVARAIHVASARRRKPMIAIDCSAMPPNLMESELFGHEAGAFTGADRLKRGKVEMAEGGTLLLDEIGEMQPDLQPKLLRFLEERYFYRVGGTRPIQSDVRVIAATNRNLQQEIVKGHFRQDLLYRLNVMPIHLPPLRQSPEDAHALVDYYAPRLAARIGKPYLGLVDEAWSLLEKYPWPGNARELRHGLERALILSDDGILRPEHFQLTLPDATQAGASDLSSTERVEITQHGSTGKNRKYGLPTLEQVEAQAIRHALRFAQGNRVLAAKILGIHRNTLARKVHQHQIAEE